MINFKLKKGKPNAINKIPVNLTNFSEHKKSNRNPR